MIPVDKGDTALTDMLLQDPRTDLNAVSHEGKTALILAIENNKPEITNQFLHENLVERIEPSINHQDVSEVEICMSCIPLVTNNVTCR